MSHDDPARPPTGRIPRWVPEETPGTPERRVTAWQPDEAVPPAPIPPPPAGGWQPHGSGAATSGAQPGAARWQSYGTPPGAAAPSTPPPPAADWQTYGSSVPAEPSLSDWQPGATPGPNRRRLITRLSVVIAIALGGYFVATSVLPGYLKEAEAPFLDGVVAGRVPDPAPQVEALAAEMHLTDEGRDLLYVSEPELLGLEEFVGRCDRDDTGAAGATGTAVGCYHSADGIRAGGRIVIYTPADERLRGFVVSTAAHELLHAAWTDLTAAERTTATPLLESALRQVPADDDLRTQLEGSVAGNPDARATELFAYLGTQVYPEGGLDPTLEDLYARYITDRAALVAVHAAFTQQISDMTTAVTNAQQALAQRQYDQANGVAQLQADEANLAQYRGTIEQEEARLAGMSASQRSRALLAWTWRDGTPLPEAPAADLLRKARELLARDEADLAARRAQLDAAAAEVAAEEQRVAAQRAELEELLGQLNPGSS